MRRGFTLIELMIVVAIIAIIAAIAIPNLLASRRQANEATAITSLKDYAHSQYLYQKSNLAVNNGLTEKQFCPTFQGLGGSNAHVDGNGNPIDLLNATIADADASTNGYQGYYFQDDANIPSGEWRYRFGLFADPCIYESSGINTYYIDARGTVYMKDLGSAGSGGTTARDTTWIVP